MVHVYALTGRTAEARRILAALEREGDDADWYFIAGVYAALADKATAFICLEKAYAKRDFFLLTLSGPAPPRRPARSTQMKLLARQILNDGHANQTEHGC